MRPAASVWWLAVLMACTGGDASNGAGARGGTDMTGGGGGVGGSGGSGGAGGGGTIQPTVEQVLVINDSLPGIDARRARLNHYFVNNEDAR